MNVWPCYSNTIVLMYVNLIFIKKKSSLNNWLKENNKILT